MLRCDRHNNLIAKSGNDLRYQFTESINDPRIYTVSKCTIIGGIFPNRLSKTMDWRKLIHPNPKTATSQPAPPETRLSVEFLLGFFAAGWTEQQVLEKYPTLTSPKLRAALAAADSQLVSSIANPELLEIIKQTREELTIGKKLPLQDTEGDVWE